MSLNNTPLCPNLSSAFPSLSEKHTIAWETPARLIKPSYAPHGISHIEFDPYLFFMEQLVRKVIPEALLTVLVPEKSPSVIKEKMVLWNSSLPLLVWNAPERAPCTVTATLLCPFEFTQGIGRYLSDTLCRWLIPGQLLTISSIQALNFRFTLFPEQVYFLQQITLDIQEEQTRLLILNNQHALTREVCLNILAVKHARQVMATKKLSSEQKQALIQENIASISQRPSPTMEQNAFEQMHHFILQLSIEDQIKEQPRTFDREIFHEIKYFVLLLHHSFTTLRSLRHVSRLISFQYFFRKILKRKIFHSSQERHLSLKLLHTELCHPSQSRPKRVLGILGGINVLRENEVFEERHILEAIQHCLPNIRKVTGSFIHDRRSYDPVRIFYIEVEKGDGTPFTLLELKILRKNLPRELKENIANVIHPVFMPRNEEEILRNIVILSQQLKYIHDLPQVIISYDIQTEEELSFTVILLRVLNNASLPSIPALFQHAHTPLKLEAWEAKKVGMLRKKYAKEANVFTVKLDKRPFLRKDHTLDIFKARQTLSAELHRILDGIRDFNGGILSKQQEVFLALRASCATTTVQQDFLLENFFYALTPPLRQSLLLPSVLKQLFMLLLEALERDDIPQTPFLKASSESDHFLLIAASPHAGFKEKVIAAVAHLQIPSSILSWTQVHAYGVHCLGYIYHHQDPHQRALFYEAIHDALKEEALV